MRLGGAAVTAEEAKLGWLLGVLHLAFSLTGKKDIYQAILIMSHKQDYGTPYQTTSAGDREAECMDKEQLT